MQGKNNSSYEIGLDGEGRVMQYLENSGFAIVHHRYKTDYGEIDIVAKNENLIIFCEVKVRKMFNGGEITKSQWERIENASLVFLEQNPQYQKVERRYDVIFIGVNGRFEHIKGFEI